MRLIKLFCLFVLILGLGLAISRSAIAASGWISVGDAVPTRLLQQVVQENFSKQVQGKVNPRQMRVLKIQVATQKQPLYIFDSRTNYQNPAANLLCGVAGCNYLGYVPSRSGYQRVLSLYANPSLPKGVALIEPTGKIQNGLPCLNFNQLAGNGVEAVQVCFNGEKYFAEN